MTYSNFAMHCPSCDKINEPVNNTRTRSGDSKAAYRCGDCDKTWRQVFSVNHEAPEITPPEEQNEQQKPPPPTGDVLDDWNEDQRDNFITHYGMKAYQQLVAEHIKTGHAEYKTPEEEPAMPQDFDPRKWTSRQIDNFIEKYGRETYQQRVADQYNPAED